jgi:hypothetical protein
MLRMENVPIMKGGRAVNEFWTAKSRKSLNNFVLMPRSCMECIKGLHDDDHN